MSSGSGDKLLVTVDEAARRLSLGRTTVYTLLVRGDIESVKVGRARRVPVRALTRFVQGQLDAAQEERSYSP